MLRWRLSATDKYCGVNSNFAECLALIVMEYANALELASISMSLPDGEIQILGIITLLLTAAPVLIFT